jgi:hypothetical protein
MGETGYDRNPPPPSASTFSLPRRVLYILKRATQKFPGDLAVWLAYVEYASREGMRKVVAKGLNRCVAFRVRGCFFSLNSLQRTTASSSISNAVPPLFISPSPSVFTFPSLCHPLYVQSRPSFHIRGERHRLCSGGDPASAYDPATRASYGAG